jgi:hypothetical protein
VEALDGELEAMIMNLRSIAQFWQDEEASLIQMNDPAERARRLDPQRLRTEISGWKHLQAEFLSAASAFPLSVEPVEISTKGDGVYDSRVGTRLDNPISELTDIRLLHRSHRISKVF